MNNVVNMKYLKQGIVYGDLLLFYFFEYKKVEGELF